MRKESIAEVFRILHSKIMIILYHPKFIKNDKNECCILNRPNKK